MNYFLPSGTVTFNYVVGNISQFGSWNTGAASPLSADNYPLWSFTLDLPVSTYVEYKYIKKEEAGLSGLRRRHAGRAAA